MQKHWVCFQITIVFSQCSQIYQKWTILVKVVDKQQYTGIFVFFIYIKLVSAADKIGVIVIFWKVARLCLIPLMTSVRRYRDITISSWLVHRLVALSTTVKTSTYRSIWSCSFLQFSLAYISFAHSLVANHRITSLYRVRYMYKMQSTICT